MKKEIIVLNIGKNGVSDSIISEIKTLLKKYKRVKLKFLQNCPDRDNFNDVINIIVSKTNSILENKKGFTVEISKI
jgi:RNA-binding protein YhbY